MMTRIFLDTDVLLDVILERKGFSEEALQILELQDNNRINAYTSTLSLANIAYFSRKFGKDPFQIIGTLMRWITIVGLEKKHFDQVVNSSFKDFEDGLQYFTSLEVDGLDAIITRNVKDYRNSSVPIFTPKEFLAAFEA